jgi:hypothetical protein
LFVGREHKTNSGLTQHVLFKCFISNGNSTTDEPIVTFTESVTAVDVSSNGVFVIAGSRLNYYSQFNPIFFSDHKLKYLRISDESSSYEVIKHHELNGAVVFITIDPTSTYYAVSTSNGNVTTFAIEDLTDNTDILEISIHKSCKAFNPA